jgi:hypothetical protein
MSDDDEYYEDDLDGEWLWFEEADNGVAVSLAFLISQTPRRLLRLITRTCQLRTDLFSLM